jgi:hypothetical protein
VRYEELGSTRHRLSYEGSVPEWQRKRGRAGWQSGLDPGLLRVSPLRPRWRPALITAHDVVLKDRRREKSGLVPDCRGVARVRDWPACGLRLTR